MWAWVSSTAVSARGIEGEGPVVQLALGLRALEHAAVDEHAWRSLGLDQVAGAGDGARRAMELQTDRHAHSTPGTLEAALDQLLPGLARRIGKAEEIEVLRRHHAAVDEVLEVDEALPELRIIEHDGQRVVHLAGLAQRQDLEEFVHGAEAAGKHHERRGAHGEMHLAHGEIVEAEGEVRRRIGVGLLLHGERDVEADRGGARIMRRRGSPPP